MKIKPLYKKLAVVASLAMVLWMCTGTDQIFDDPYSTVVTSQKGELLGAHIARDGQWRFPMIDSVPRYFRDAILTYEDKRFYDHPGVDIVAIGRAIISNVRAHKVKSGASTLTMQAIRLSRKGKPRSLWQKVIEATLAIRLELATEKEEVLRMYASHAPYGGNVVGLETASWRYFQKSPHHLSLAESAMLAVLPNAPSLIHLSRNRTRLKEKRDHLLAKMLSLGKVDSLSYELALVETIPDKPYPLPRLATHLLQYLKKSTEKGSRFETTLDKSIQEMITDVSDYHQEIYTQSNIHNMGILVLDTWTGEVLGYLGNAPHATQESAVDMVQAKRSSGSVLKPMLYAHMIDEGILTPQMLVKDVPTQIAGFRPRNYDRTHRGAISAEVALSQSLNVPAVQMLQQYKVDRFLKKLSALGLHSIDKSADHYGLSLILGGAEVSLWELCGAYASMGRILSRFTTSMSTYGSHDILPPSWSERTIDTADLYRPVDLSAGSIYHTFKAMEQVSRPDQEGKWRSFSSRHKIAWKTGTSYGHRDAWAIGVTERYTVGVWVGNADGEGVHGLVGVKKAAPVLFDVFNRLPDDKYFDTPIDDLVSQVVCHHSGHLAGPYCDMIDTVSLVKAAAESMVCPYHQLVHLDEHDQRVYLGCTEADVRKASWFVLPPVMAYYYRQRHPEYQSLPSYNPDCQPSDSESPIEFIYPHHGASVFIPHNLKGQREKIIAKATHKDNEQKLYWHLDEQYIGHTDDHHDIDVLAGIGSHVLTIVDEQGHEARQWFTVVGE